MQGAARREHSHSAALRVHAPGGWPSFVSPIETEESSGLSYAQPTTYISVHSQSPTALMITGLHVLPPTVPWLPLSEPSLI